MNNGKEKMVKLKDQSKKSQHLSKGVLGKI